MDSQYREQLQYIRVPDPDIIIHTDSSILGWNLTDGKSPSSGRWKADDISHINVVDFTKLY